MIQFSSLVPEAGTGNIDMQPRHLEILLQNRCPRMHLALILVDFQLCELKIELDLAPETE
jgi:hypothetical protein